MEKLQRSLAMDRVVLALEETYRDDPEALSALLKHQVPWTNDKAKCPMVLGVVEGQAVISPIGLVNMVLDAVGLDRVYYNTEDDDPTGEFGVWEPGKEALDAATES